MIQIDIVGLTALVIVWLREDQSHLMGLCGSLEELACLFVTTTTPLNGPLSGNTQVIIPQVIVRDYPGEPQQER